MGLDGSEIKSCCNQRWGLTTTTNYVVEIFGSINVEIFGSIKVEKSDANYSGTPSAMIL